MTTEQAAEAWALLHSMQAASDRLRDLIGRCSFMAWDVDRCLIDGARYLESEGHAQPTPGEGQDQIYTGPQPGEEGWPTPERKAAQEGEQP